MAHNSQTARTDSSEHQGNAQNPLGRFPNDLYTAEGTILTHKDSTMWLPESLHGWRLYRNRNTGTLGFSRHARLMDIVQVLSIQPQEAGRLEHWDDTFWLVLSPKSSRVTKGLPCSGVRKVQDTKTALNTSPDSPWDSVYEAASSQFLLLNDLFIGYK